MARGRRSIAVFLLLSALAGLAAAWGAIQILSGGSWPRRDALPWNGMEVLLESQAIASTALDLHLDLDGGRIEGTATLAVTRPGGAGDRVFLLLNPGLQVRGVRCNDGAVSWRREGERLAVTLPPETVACSLAIDYAGAMTPANSAPLVTTPDLFIADRLQFWYPLDLKSYTAFTADIRLPDTMEVAWGGVSPGVETGDGMRTVSWTETRPVLAVGLAAGRFERQTRLQGSVRCNIFSEAGAGADADAWLTALGDAYNYYTTLLGPDGFQQLNLVVAGDAPGILQIGGPTIVAAPGLLADPDQAFAAIAGQVARNWWGDTVSGRWFTGRPEAGEWLLSGMSEYFAWQALRQTKGRRAYLRFMEQQYFPPAAPEPMKHRNLDGRLHGKHGPDARPLQVRGAYAAAAIAQFIGPEAFMRACRNFMAVHRHSTVSYAALLHEMTLASERPLDELVRVWFDRPGSLDYGITSVSVEGDTAHVTIQNTGDIPALAPLTVGVMTSEGYHVQTVIAAAQSTGVRFHIDSPLKRVVLDPEFDLGDMKRANNVWPPTQWPLAIDVSRNGRIAMLAQTAWGGVSARRLFVFSLVDKAPSHAIAPGDGALATFQWDRDGQKLALRGDLPGIWRGETWAADPPGAVFLGWRGEDPLYWRDGALDPPDGGAGDGSPVPLPAPIPGSAAIHPDSGEIAYVTDSRVLAVWDPVTERLNPLRDDVRLAGGLRWRGNGAGLIYFDTRGTLYAVDTHTGAAEALLERNYAIQHARLSQGGGRAAWVDPAGLLRAFTPGGGEAVYISLPGEVVDFAWEGEDAIVSIVAAVPRRLPMRFHADYTLWRIPASTWTGLQLPYDPAQFAAAGEVPLVRAE